MASLMFSTTPRVRSTPTTSLAIVLIQAIATTKPRKQSRDLQCGGRFAVVLVRINASMQSDAVRE